MAAPSLLSLPPIKLTSRPVIGFDQTRTRHGKRGDVTSKASFQLSEFGLIGLFAVYGILRIAGIDPFAKMKPDCSKCPGGGWGGGPPPFPADIVCENLRQQYQTQFSMGNTSYANGLFFAAQARGCAWAASMVGPGGGPVSPPPFSPPPPPGGMLPPGGGGGGGRPPRK